MLITIMSIFLYNLIYNDIPPFCFYSITNILLPVIACSAISWFLLSLYFISKKNLRKNGIILLSILFIFVITFLIYIYFSPWTTFCIPDYNSFFVSWCYECYHNNWSENITVTNEIRYFLNYKMCRENKWISINSCADSIELCEDMFGIV